MKDIDNPKFIFFLYNINPMSLAVFGTVSNLLVIAVFSRPKFKNNIYTYLFRILAVNDLINCWKLPLDISHFTGVDLVHSNKLNCQIIMYFLNFTSNFNSWLIVFISVHRYFTMFQHKVKLFTKKRFITLCLAILFIYNLIFISFYTLHLDLVYYNLSTNGNVIFCMIADEDEFFIWNYTAIISSTIIPFILMIICSILIITRIMVSRSKLRANNPTANEAKKRTRDIKFSITIISLNVIFLVFNMSLLLANLPQILPYDMVITFKLIQELFFIQFTCNLFIYILVFENFWQELLLMLRLKRIQEFRLDLSFFLIHFTNYLFLHC
jgi:hypothetical protein